MRIDSIVNIDCEWFKVNSENWLCTLTFRTLWFYWNLIIRLDLIELSYRWRRLRRQLRLDPPNWRPNRCNDRRPKRQFRGTESFFCFKRVEIRSCEVVNFDWNSRNLIRIDEFRFFEILSRFLELLLWFLKGSNTSEISSIASN